MDYAEARAAFFGPRQTPTRPLDWDSPARRLRDALEPLATICFWSEPAYLAYTEVGLDFLQGYVYGRGSVLGDVEPGVAAAAFGVFEPGLIADTFAAGRAACPVVDVAAARLRGSIEALRVCLGEDPTGLAEIVTVLRRGVQAADPTGRALHAGVVSRPWPEHPLGQLWHGATALREHRGDGHLAALVAAGITGVQANQLTELWVGWDALAYTGSRAWSEAAMAAGAAALRDRGLLDEDGLTAQGRDLRAEIEDVTDRSVAPVLEAIGPDLDRLVETLSTWSDQVIARGWFPPDPYKRAAG